MHPPKLAPKMDPYDAALRLMFWVVCGAVVALGARLAWPIVTRVVDVLTPFVIGLILAYVLHPVVQTVQVRFRMGRKMGIATVAAIVAGGATILLLILLPIVAQQANLAIRATSAYLEKLDRSPEAQAAGEEQSLLSKISNRFSALSGKLLGRDEPEKDSEESSAPADAEAAPDAEAAAPALAEEPTTATVEAAAPEPAAPASATQTRSDDEPTTPSDPSLGELIEEHNDLLRKSVSGVLGALQATFSALGTIGGWIATATLTILATFYYLIEMRRLPGIIRRLLPKTIAPRAWDILLKADQSVGGFLRGQLMACVGVGLLTMVLLLIVGPRKYAVLIGFVAGTVNFIPYLGPAMGAIPALAWGAFTPMKEGLGDRGTYAALVVAGFGLIQAIDGVVFQPLIVGSQAALHPLAVMLALVIGAQFGVGGMILAVPFARVVKVILSELYWKRTVDFLEPTGEGSAPPDAEAAPDEAATPRPDA